MAALFRITCFLPLLATLGNAATTPSFIRASSELGDHHFYDDAGRVRIFHGANRVKKSIPWYFPEMLEDEKEMELMKRMGLTVVRLGYMWSGVNPSEGVFNQTYVDTIKNIVQKLADHGVYALLDMHEDVLSSKFCLYDGAPRWVIEKSQPKHPHPWPMKGNCSSRGWMANTLSEAAATAYQDIYDNKHGMLDDLAAMWAYSAEQFKDVPNVIGYEIMNEPFAGNFYEDPTLLLPGRAGGKNLDRMNQAVAAAIRKHDDRHLIFYEPVTWGMLFDGKIVGSGYSEVPGGPAYRNRSVFSYHYYCHTFDPKYPNDKPGSITRDICDKVTGPLVFKAVQKDLAHLGGAQMMTEGLSSEDGWKTKASECSGVAKHLDDNLFSWTDYSDSQTDVWAPSEAQQAGWARTYARAIAGTPLNMTFDVETKAFEFCWALDPAISAPTEIFASTVYTYNGTAANNRAVKTTDNVVVAKSSDADLIVLNVAKGVEAVKGSTACVWVTRDQVGNA